MHEDLLCDSAIEIHTLDVGLEEGPPVCGGKGEYVAGCRLKSKVRALN